MSVRIDYGSALQLPYHLNKKEMSEPQIKYIVTELCLISVVEMSKEFKNICWGRIYRSKEYSGQPI